MKKKICFITALLLLVATISSALAVEIKNSSGSHYNATYEITSIGSCCKLLAKATLTVARTATYNIGNSSYYCMAFLKEYKNGTLTLTKTADSVLASGGVCACSKSRTADSTAYKYVHTSYRYGVSNSSYANDSTLAESITYTAYQY